MWHRMICLERICCFVLRLFHHVLQPLPHVSLIRTVYEGVTSTCLGGEEVHV